MKFLRQVLMNTAGDGGAGGGNAGAGSAGGAAPAAASAGASASGAAAAPAAGGAAPAAAAPAANAGNAGAGNGATGSAGQPAPDWQSPFDEGTRGYIANKGWKEPGHLLESYRNLEKAFGASPDQVIRLPKADDPQATDAMNRIYDQLGRPKTPDAYKLEIPKENGSPEFAKAASETFHKLGLSEKQGQELVKWWNEQQANTMKVAGEQKTMAVNDSKVALQKEWGAAHEQNLGLAKRAAKEFGVPGAVIDALDSHMGYNGVMKFFHNIGSKLGSEGNFHSGNTPAGNGSLTPVQAQSKIAELRNDKQWVSRYLAGDSSARTEMEKLNRFAIGEAF